MSAARMLGLDGHAPEAASAARLLTGSLDHTRGDLAGRCDVDGAPLVTHDRVDQRVCRVVLADDDPRLLDALHALLGTATGIEVVALARSGPEAEDACMRHEPDVAVLDVHMPGGGLRAARRIVRRHPGLRVVVLTADETPAVRAAARAAGADVVLDKAGGGDVVAAVLAQPSDTRGVRCPAAAAG